MRFSLPNYVWTMFARLASSYGDHIKYRKELRRKDLPRILNANFWMLCKDLPWDSHMLGGRDADDGFVVETLGGVCVKHEHARVALRSRIKHKGVRANSPNNKNRQGRRNRLDGLDTSCGEQGEEVGWGVRGGRASHAVQAAGVFHSPVPRLPATAPGAA